MRRQIGRGLLGMDGASFVFDLAGDDGFHNYVEYRDKNEGEGGGGEHAAANGGADGDAAGASRALSQDQRKNSQNKSERSHEDGAEADARGFDRGIDDRAALSAKLLSKFDDQDGVFARQADEHDQTDLAVHIVLQSAQSL